MSVPIKKIRYVQYVSEYLRNGAASNNMNVNGSSTPVEYTITVPSGQIWAIESLSVIILDSGATTDPVNFGGISNGLANGLKIEVRSRGTVYDLVNLKNNIDIVTTFNGNAIGHGSVGGLDVNIGFLGSVDNFSGILNFGNPMVFSEKSGDYIKAIVRDNLTALNLLGIKCLAFREF